MPLNAQWAYNGKITPHRDTVAEIKESNIYRKWCYHVLCNNIVYISVQLFDNSFSLKFNLNVN